MTVEQLREALASMPGYLPVVMAVPVSDIENGEFTDYYYALDVTREHELPRGNFAVVVANRSPS